MVVNTQRPVAVITGSSRDIGRAIALRLAQEGTDVVIHSMSSVEQGEKVASEAEALGVRAMYHQCNVRDFEEVGRMYDAIRNRMGPVTILVNSAAWTSLLPFDQNNQEYWDKIVNTKFYGFIYNVFHALPHLKENGYGKIVNLAGESGRIGVSRGVVHSGVQGAIIAMTKSWAREFAPYGIRVNTVSPGPIDTSDMPRYEAMNPDLYEAGGEMDSVLGRASIDDIAAAVAFFCRRESDKITGQTLSVSGGRSFAS